MQWRMLQHHTPSDFVISSGSNYSVREFVVECMNCVGISVKFEGEGEREVGIVTKLPPRLASSGLREGGVFLEVDPRLFRPTEVQFLLGDSSKAERELGWVPKTSFSELVREMLVADLQDVGRGDIVWLKDV